MTKDYRLDIRVRNNRMLERMELMGIASGLELSRRSGVSYTTVHGYLSLKRDGMGNDGKWSDAALNVAAVLRCCPEDIFPPKLHKNRAEVRVDAAEMAEIGRSFRLAALPAETRLLAEETRKVLADAINELPAKHVDILCRRFGVDGERQTLEEVGKVYGVTRERIRDQEAKALRSLRAKLRGKITIDDLRNFQ